MTVNEELPTCEGVPDRSPPGERERPAGRDPVVNENVYGAVPPDAAIVWLYDAPTELLGRLAGVTEIDGQVIITV